MSISISFTSGTSYTCPLCSKEEQFIGDQFRLHLFQHFGYKKYPCDSCGKHFYSEDERENHCKDKRHASSYEITGNPYCEMLTNMIIKDCELLRTHDMSTLIAEKRILNIDLENRLSVKIGSPRENKSPPPSSRKQKSILKRKIPEGTSDSEKRGKTPKESHNKERRRTQSIGPSNQSQDEDMNMLSPTRFYKPIPEVASESPLRPVLTASANVACQLCRKEVDMLYTHRKEHVSKCHIGANHSDDDYTSVLEGKMKKAFPGLTYCDLQCQECKLKFYSNSGRRKHVQLTHIRRRLDCPMDGCQYSGVSTASIQKHLRTFHDLDGYKNIDDRRAKDQFSQQAGIYTRYVQDIFDRCFPCVIPGFYEESKNLTTAVSNTVISSLRGRFSSPGKKSGMPLRYASDSSDSGAENRSLRRARRARQEEPQPEIETDEEMDEEILIVDYATDDIKNVNLLPREGLSDRSKSVSEDQSQPEAPNIEEEQIRRKRNYSTRNINENRNEPPETPRILYKSPIPIKSSNQAQPSTSFISPWVIAPWKTPNPIKEEKDISEIKCDLPTEQPIVLNGPEINQDNNVRQNYRQATNQSNCAPFRPPYSIFPKPQ